VAKAARAAAVAEVSAVLGLDALLERRPVQLSGGQRQRVALARAIVRRPAAFLMDEPLSNLDAKLRVQTRAELIDLQRRFGATVVYVTHDQVEAMTMGHRIAVMVDGTLQQVDTPAEVHARPANVFVAGFIGTPPMNLLDGEVVAADPDAVDDGDGLAVEVAGAPIVLPPALGATVRAAGSREVVVGIRPEHVAVDPAGQVASTVTVVEALGHENHVVTTTSDGGTLTARTSGDDTGPADGETVRLRLDPGRLHLFDRASGDRIGP
jgi:multiple sugar transport system ATP-binding protein